MNMRSYNSAARRTFTPSFFASACSAMAATPASGRLTNSSRNRRRSDFGERLYLAKRAPLTTWGRLTIAKTGESRFVKKRERSERSDSVKSSEWYRPVAFIPTSITGASDGSKENRREPPAPVRPGPAHREATGRGHLRHLCRVELVRALGVDRLPRGEADLQAEVRDRDCLLPQALQVHLDPAEIHVPARPVAEGTQVEPSPQLLVDPHQDVQVEGGGHAQGVVVRRHEDALRLLEIHPEQQAVARAEHAADLAQEHDPLAGVEVADRRAEEEDQGAEAGRDPLRAKRPQAGLVLGHEGGDGELRKGVEEPLGALFHRRARDVDRQVLQPPLLPHQRLDQQARLPPVAAPQLQEAHGTFQRARDLVRG